MVLQSVVQITGRGTAQHSTAERWSSTWQRVNVGARCNAKSSGRGLCPVPERWYITRATCNGSLVRHAVAESDCVTTAVAQISHIMSPTAHPTPYSINTHHTAQVMLPQAPLCCSPSHKRCRGRVATAIHTNDATHQQNTQHPTAATLTNPSIVHPTPHKPHTQHPVKQHTQMPHGSNSTHRTVQVMLPQVPSCCTPSHRRCRGRR